MARFGKRSILELAMVVALDERLVDQQILLVIIKVVAGRRLRHCQLIVFALSLAKT